MERLNGEIRDREKVMRGLKKKDTPILAGYQIFHNYIREHEGLDGKTPSEACGVTVERKKEQVEDFNPKRKCKVRNSYFGTSHDFLPHFGHFR